MIEKIGTFNFKEIRFLVLSMLIISGHFLGSLLIVVCLCIVVGTLMYLGQCDVEMLTGASAIQRTVERLSTDEAAKRFTTVGFKVTPEGMTVTDNERK